MNGYIKFKASKSQLTLLSEFINIRESFENNEKQHVKEIIKVTFYFLKKTEYVYDTPPSGLFWFDWGDYGNSLVCREGWYIVFLDIYQLIKDEKEVYLDKEAYNLIMEVLNYEQQ